MSEGIFFLAMPTARAIHFKSGFAPTYTLRAFRFPACRSQHAGRYPYCICQHSRNTHCAGRTSLPLPKPTQRVSLPQSIANDRDWITKARD